MNEFLFWFMEPFAKIAAICAIVITLYAAFMLWLFVATAIEKLKDRLKEKR
jgi:hypothetical protein